ncbi:hypothetical protein [Capnocytophaga canis]|uniref:hypothetical protein n=1 Tax=Capnocytophaga canis TaxID=1848903 RepID=UPI00385DDB45
MERLISFIPFVLLGFYYFFISKPQVALDFKLMTLGGILLVSLWMYLKKVRNTQTNRFIFYLFLGISGVIIAHYLKNHAG